jgi:hypothetical protein
LKELLKTKLDISFQNKLNNSQIGKINEKNK